MHTSAHTAVFIGDKVCVNASKYGLEWRNISSRSAVVVVNNCEPDLVKLASKISLAGYAENRRNVCGRVVKSPAPKRTEDEVPTAVTFGNA